MAKRGRRTTVAAWGYLFLFWCNICVSLASTETHNEVDSLHEELDEIFASEGKEHGVPLFTCEPPEAPENGYIEGTDYSMGSRVFVRCNHGYHLVGSAPMTCLAVPDPFRRVVIWDPSGERKCVETAPDMEDEEHLELPQLWNPEEDPHTNHAETDGEDEEEIEYEEGAETPVNEEEMELVQDKSVILEPLMLDEILKDTPEHPLTPRPSRATLPEYCLLKSVRGMCKALFRRYFFNKNTMQCEQFSYGGCGGNKNNFETMKDCETACARARSEIDHIIG